MRLRISLYSGLVFSLLIIVLSVGCAAGPADAASFDNRFKALVKPYTFNYAAWEFKTLSHQLSQIGTTEKNTDLSDASIVEKYFSISQERQNQVLKDEVEKILAGQISQVLADQGIYNPFTGWHISFPPVNFVLETPPDILIVSPRDKIQRIRDVTLKQDMSIDQMQKLESEIEQLNVSALVIPIGGLGAAYPSFIMESSDLKYTIDTAAEEWLHQYLVFKPLGFNYGLDLLRIKPDSDIESLNETVAGLASEEIGDLVLSRYYPQYPQTQEKPPEPGAFDFNAAMRETRLNVDAYLAAGQVEQAESYMEQRRQFINSHGYNIRKLNQAYFAFYGSYTYSGTSVDPLGNQVKLLRRQSLSLKDFLKTASGITSRQGLTSILSEKQ